MAIDNAYLDEKITTTKALIDAYEAATLAILSEQIQSYSFDTGQTKQTVTKANLAVLTTATDVLYSRLSDFCNRRGNTAIIVRAGF